MENSSHIGIAKQTRVLWSVLALLSIVFHVGLAAVHCHDLEGFQGKIGIGVEKVQESQGPEPADDDEGACVICQLLSVFKGTARQSLAVAGNGFAGMALLFFLWQAPFIPLWQRLTGQPRAPPLS